MRTLTSDSQLADYCRIVHRQSQNFWWQGATREDVEQEAWLAIYEARPASHALAKTIVRRRLRDKLRAEQRRPQFSVLIEARDVTDPVDVIEARQGLERLARLALSDVERDAMIRALNGDLLGSKRMYNALDRVRAKWAA